MPILGAFVCCNGLLGFSRAMLLPLECGQCFEG